MNINDAIKVFYESKYTKFQSPVKYAIDGDNIIILSKSSVPDYAACSCWIIKHDGKIVPSNILWFNTDDIKFNAIDKDEIK